MAQHFPSLPTCTSPSWRKGTEACETYAEITMPCQLQWAGSCCSVGSVNTLYCAGKLWGLAVLVCLLLSLRTGRFSCISVWEMSICCMAFLGARRKIFYLAFLVSCCQIMTRHSTLWSRLLTTSRAGAGRLTLSQMERDFFSLNHSLNVCESRVNNFQMDHELRVNNFFKWCVVKQSQMVKGLEWTPSIAWRELKCFLLQESTAASDPLPLSCPPISRCFTCS